MKTTTDIVLRNSCGGELDRVTVGKYQEPALRLMEVLLDGMWVLDEGDTISIESADHED